MFDGVEQVEVGDALASQFDLESRAGAKEILDATEQIGSWLRTLGDVAVIVRVELSSVLGVGNTRPISPPMAIVPSWGCAAAGVHFDAIPRVLTLGRRDHRIPVFTASLYSGFA
jgi:hypothetical protein